MTSYMTTVQQQNKKTDIAAIMLTTLHILLSSHQFFHALMYTCVYVTPQFNPKYRFA